MSTDIKLYYTTEVQFISYFLTKTVLGVVANECGGILYGGFNDRDIYMRTNVYLYSGCLSFWVSMPTTENTEAFSRS